MAAFEEQVLPAVRKALATDLPDVECSFFRGGKLVTEMGRPSDERIEVYAFPQAWGDTSLGFGGMAGQSITAAYTTVVICDHVMAVVYIGGRLAYKVDVTPEFWSDVRACCIRGISDKPGQKYKLHATQREIKQDAF